MKLNKILFFPCLCLLLLGMVDAVHARKGPRPTNESDDTQLLLTYGSATKNPYSLPLDQPPKCRKVCEEVKKKAPYYGMRATLPVYSLLTNRPLCIGGGFVLGVMLGGGMGWTSLVGGVAGALAGSGIAWKLQRDTGGSWMRAYLKSALNADIDKETAIINAVQTFDAFTAKQAQIASVRSDTTIDSVAWVRQLVNAMKKDA